MEISPSTKKTYKVLIIEDTQEDSEKLIQMLNENSICHLTIEDEAKSVVEASQLLQEKSEYDLIFMDIQLPDGEAFDIFNHIDLEIPIIFTSSYEHYALRALKIDGIDYLLKPLKEEELAFALQNFIKRLEKESYYQLADIRQLVERLLPKSYKSSFLVNYKQKMILVSVEEIAYFYIKDTNTYLKAFDDRSYHLETTLDDLEDQLDPKKFYRVNRQFFVARKSIKEIENYFTGRLMLLVHPKSQDNVIISKKKAMDFKKWADD